MGCETSVEEDEVEEKATYFESLIRYFNYNSSPGGFHDTPCKLHVENHMEIFDPWFELCS